jgi:hypothetical protein
VLDDDHLIVNSSEGVKWAVYWGEKQRELASYLNKYIMVNN